MKCTLLSHFFIPLYLHFSDHKKCRLIVILLRWSVKKGEKSEKLVATPGWPGHTYNCLVNLIFLRPLLHSEFWLSFWKPKNMSKSSPSYTISFIWFFVILASLVLCVPSVNCHPEWTITGAMCKVNCLGKASRVYYKISNKFQQT